MENLVNFMVTCIGDRRSVNYLVDFSADDTFGVEINAIEERNSV